MQAATTLPLDTIISRLRQRTVAEIIDAAFRLYRRHFRTFLIIAALVYLPVQLLSFLADAFLLGTYQTPDFTDFRSSAVATRNVTSQISSLKTYMETILEYFGQWALTVAVAGAVLDRSVSVREAYSAMGRRIGRVLGLVGLQTLILLGVLSPLLCALIVVLLPGSGGGSSLLPILCLSPFTLLTYFVIQVRLQLALPAAVNEDLAPREAIRRSWELTRNYWRRTFALSVVLSILSVIVALGPASLIVAVVGLGLKLDFYGNLALTSGIGILTTTIFVPIEIGAIALYYYDQRVRKEGFDLDTAIAHRYEAGEGYAQYGQPQFGREGAPQPTSYIPAAPPAFSTNVQGDDDLHPWLASGQYERAMRTYQKRPAKSSRVRRRYRPIAGTANAQDAESKP